MVNSFNRASIQRQLESVGIDKYKKVSINLSEPELYEKSIVYQEGQLTDSGAFSVDTGQHKGRSAEDKYIIRDELTEDSIWWENNQEMSPAAFERLKQDISAHANGKEIYVQDLYGGASKGSQLSVRVITEKAWHALFNQEHVGATRRK